jgi:N-sulfoglucosamine sulfohydrolase
LIIKWPNKIKPGSIDSSHLISSIDLMPTVLNALNLPLVPNLDGRTYLPLLFGKKQVDRNYVYTTYYQIFGNKRFPMRCIQDKNFGYIYNFWSDGKWSISGDAIGGLTWKAMVIASSNNADIAERVQLFKYRVPEEFYDFKNDPDALHNLINDSVYAKEIQKLRDKMLEVMNNTKDPALQVFKDRNKNGVVKDFMIQQNIKSSQTKKDVSF